jgi:inhibitor of KinA
VKILPLGDSALLVDFAEESSDPAELLDRALSAVEAIARANIPGIIEITSAYQSVAVFLSHHGFEDGSLTERISQTVASAEKAPRLRHQEIEIPVCYDQDFALDMKRVGNETKLTFSQVVELHCSAVFTVVCLGFMPGFPYLAGLPDELHVPRLATPRTKVPAGSVAIAGPQAGIYPFDSPGGWNIIGRTPLKLFDTDQNRPTFFSAGDRVRFRPISRDEFDAAPA